MKFTELPNVGITNIWRENIFSYLKETRSHERKKIITESLLPHGGVSLAKHRII